MTGRKALKGECEVMRRVSVLTCCLPLLAAHLLTLLLHWMVFDGSIRLSEGASQGYGCLDLPEVDPNPEYGEWTVFVPCSRTITQTRTCCKILQREGQSVLVNCRGQDVDGGIGEWNPWMACRESIPQCKDGATRIRTRQCNNPTPKQCGKGCNAHEMVEVYNPNCKPVHGGWSDWSYFSPCRVTCGQGLKERNRMCTKPRRACGGRLCEGGQPIKPHQDVQEDIDVQKCSAPVACKCDAVDGQWSTWSAFSECTVSCFDTAGGTQYRTRKCNSPAPQCGGAPCQGKDRQTLGCGFQPCCDPVDGGWSPWTSYAACGVTCGGGSQTRSRSCTRPRPSCGGRPCSGNTYQSRRCNTNPCCVIVHGGWSQWSSFSSCPVTCGGGSQTRSRSCTNPLPSCGGTPCSGNTFDSRPCATNKCCVPTDGGWSRWSGYSACTVTCGGGSQTRSRKCNSPSPSCGGRDCPGASNSRRSCSTNECCVTVHGGWSRWSSFSTCPVTCGGGSQTRSRSCTNPKPSCGGSKCYGNTYQSRPCATTECCVPIDGGWSRWSGYSACTVTCGGGSQTRSRNCNSPSPSCGGRDCPGASNSRRSCSADECCVTVHGGWSRWSSFSTCPVTCGGGSQTRSRSCTNPKPSCGGSKCYGNTYQSRPCATTECCVPTDGGWSRWSGYSACTVTCGGGSQTRSRKCNSPSPSCGGRDCPGASNSRRSCSADECCVTVHGGWSRWSSFSTCPVTCGGGSQTRSRSCTNPKPSCGGSKCYGNTYQSRPCATTECCVPIDGGWSRWSGYSTCPVTCGGGTQTRSRKCNSPSPSCGGRDCPGASHSSRSCSTNKCCDAARHGWTEWSSYGECSRTCGVGTQQKSRTCKAGSGTACSSLCKGGYTASRTCTVAAARDGGWSQWRTGACLSTCGSGVKERTRTCTNPAPNQCGQPCPGPASDYQQCTGLPSCCENYGKTGADISIAPDEVTVTDDKTSATSIVQCKAITCGGDNLRELRVRYKLTENTAGKTEYAAAKWDSDGGRVVDKVGLSSTSVVGSIGVGFINYIFLKVRCDDAGYYECYTNIQGSGGKSQESTKTKALTVTVNPTRFTLTPVKFAGELKVGDVLKLKCSGSVGTLDDNSQVDIVWEYQDKDSSTWNKVQKPDVATITSASPGNCSAMTEARVLTLILTSDDRGRTYRCFLRKNGIDLNTQYSKFTVIINSTLKPVARAFLTIQPNSVTLYSVSSPAVTVMCRAMRSQNPLTSLVVSHRAKHLNFTVQPNELAVTDTDSKVASVADLTITSVTGGLAERLINYTIIQVLCDDDGVYFCTATTTLATTTRTDTEEKVLEVKMEPYRSTLTPSVSGGVEVNTELKLQCSTLTNDTDQQEAVLWQWQYTTDPNPNNGLWLDMETSVLRPIVTNRRITSHNCFNISTTNLTFERVSRSDFGKYYRCYVIRGDTEYVQYAAVYKLRENKKKLVLKASGLAKLLGAIFGGVIGFALIALLAYALCKRRRSSRTKAAVSGSHSVPRVVRTASVPLGMLPPPVAVLPQAQVIARPSVIEVVEEPSSFYSSSEVSSSVYDDDDASSVYSEAESSGYPVIVQTSRY